MSKKTQKHSKKVELPEYCDYTCKYAEFSDPNSIGACRKELAVWCAYFSRYNNKNNKCLQKQ